jgi:hypothetical protein
MYPSPPGIRITVARGAEGRSRTAFEPPMLTVSSARRIGVLDNSIAMAEAIT